MDDSTEPRPVRGVLRVLPDDRLEPETHESARVLSRQQPEILLCGVGAPGAVRAAVVPAGDRRGLVIGVESECAAVAVVGARLGLRAAALLFCTDNVNLPRGEDHSYRGLADPRVKRGFEAGLEAVIDVLAMPLD